MLIVFCCWTPHAFEQNGSIHDTCNFSFAFASFCYQKKKGNLHNYTEWKQHNVRQSDARNFKFTLYKMWQMLDLRQNDIRPGISICEPRSIDLVRSLIKIRKKAAICFSHALVMHLQSYFQIILFSLIYIFRLPKPNDQVIRWALWYKKIKDVVNFNIFITSLKTTWPR